MKTPPTKKRNTHLQRDRFSCCLGVHSVQFRLFTRCLYLIQCLLKHGGAYSQVGELLGRWLEHIEGLEVFNFRPEPHLLGVQTWTIIQSDTPQTAKW